MRSRKGSIAVLSIVMALVFATGAVSAVAVTHRTVSAPRCGTPSVDTIPCVANGVLYVSTHSKLYAIAAKK